MEQYTFMVTMPDFELDSDLTTPIFSILIPSWNNLEYLQLCIESIRKNSHYTHQLLVHLNDGSDGSLEWVKQQPDIQYTHSPTNLGVCYPLNMLANKASTDYILYLNDDMYVCPDWDYHLYEEIKSIGHNYFFLSATAIEAHINKPCAYQKNFGNDVATFREEELLRTYEQLNIPDWQGATWPPNVVHRELWDLVGGYSIEFSPGMYSDPDFSMKLWKAGVRLFKGINKSKVYHFGSKSVSRIRHTEGYYKFIDKWGVTSSTITQLYLRRGDRFDGPLDNPTITSKIRLKNYFKRLQSALKATGKY